MTVPFFGDQAFWGEMCRRAGVGPPPVAVENLTEQHLLEGLKMLMDPLVRAVTCQSTFTAALLTHSEPAAVCFQRWSFPSQ